MTEQAPALSDLAGGASSQSRTGIVRLLLAFGVMAMLTFLTHFVGGAAWEIGVNQAFPLLVLGAWLLHALVRRKAWPASPLTLPLVIWIVVLLISATLALDPRIALEGWVKRVLWPTFGFFLVLDLFRRGWSRALWGAVYLVAWVVALITAAEYASWYWGGVLPGSSGLSWWNIGGASDPVPPTIHQAQWGFVGATTSAYLAPYWALLIPPLLGLALDEGRAVRRLTLLAVAGIAVVLMLLSFSRGGLLGLAAALAVMGGLWLGTTHSVREWLRRHRIRLMAVLGILAVLLGLWFGFLGARYFGGGHASGDTVRLALWNRALELFLSRPVWGVGLNNFALVGWIDEAPLRRVGAGSHNQALGVLAEQGLVGALMGLWVLGNAIYATVRHWGQAKQAGSGTGRLAGVIGALIGYLLASQVADLGWWPLRAPFLVFAAWAVAGESEGSAANGRRLPWVLAASAIALSAGGLGWVDRALPPFDKAVHQAQQGNWALAAELAEEAADLDRGLRVYRLQAAEFWAHAGLSPDQDVQKQEMLRRAADLYESALEPAVHPLHRENYAWVLWALGDQSAALVQATQAAKETAELAPVGPAIWLGTGAMCENAGEAELAVDAYVYALRLSPGLMASPFWRATDFRQTQWSAIYAQALGAWIENQGVETPLLVLGADSSLAAVKTLAEARLDADPASSIGLEASALKSLAQGELDQAQQHADQLCQQSAPEPACTLLQGWLSLERGQDMAALQDLQTVVFLSPGSAHAHAASYLLARLYWARGDEQQAWTWMERATRHPPPFDTRDTQLHGRRVVVAPLPLWPAIRPLPLGGAAWRTGIRWAEESGSLERLARLCQTSQEYDPFLDLCADAQP